MLKWQAYLNIIHFHMNTRGEGYKFRGQSTNPFGKVTIDQTIEETVNKLETCNYAQKYYVNAEYRSTCLKQLRSIIDQQSSRLSHHDVQSTRIKKDESDVQIAIDLLENRNLFKQKTNPFSETTGDLAGPASGRVAPNDVTSDLL